MLRLLAALLLAASLLTAPAAPAGADTHQHLVGTLHEHSGYSDGWPGTTPATYFAAGKAAGLDFFGSGEHSDNADLPITANEGCLTDPTACATDPTVNKWDATLAQADDASDETYTAFRGFEWTSDRFGHINVYFSQNDTGAKVDGGYVAMDIFYDWLGRSAALGGGADGIATFNHPGADGEEVDPGFNWNDFAYVPGADQRMVGIEVYNDTSDFGTNRGPHPEGYYVHALDKGWHVGAVGAEDLHGTPGDEDGYGEPHFPKTVVLATDNSRASIKEAMLDRRFYAIRSNDGLRLDFSVDGTPMGSRLTRDAGAPLDVVASTNRPGATVEIVTSGGQVVASGAGSVTTDIANWDPAQRYYFMRVKQDGTYIGYGSPIWVTATESKQWLAGDLHVHTCYSHDAYCGPDDHNTSEEEFYTLSGTVEERFAEASVRGLDYLAITDHHDDNRLDESGYQRSVDDPGFGTHGVLGIRAYENSLRGHAQMLGAKRIISAGDKGPAAVNAMADTLRAEGGTFQINHPGDALATPIDDSCSDTSNLDWGYGFDVAPDTLEVWNIGHIVQPPLPAGNSNDDSIRYWECWLNRGYRVGVTGGSDSHWLSLSLVQGPGNPTTWVHATERTEASILQGLRDGRTSISLVPPLFGAPRLLLEADADGDGTYEATIGDEVLPGTAMRARVDGTPVGGLLEIRSNGKTHLEEILAPGQTVDFPAPAEQGWVYAKLSGPDLRDERAQTCDPVVSTLPLSDIGGEDGRTTYCRNAIVELALTSPVYLEEPSDPSPTTLAYTGPTNVSGEVVVASARLTSEDGEPVAGEEISFENRGATATATTDGDGVAEVTMYFPDHGRTQTVDIAFAGDELHLASQTSATLRWGAGPLK